MDLSRLGLSRVFWRVSWRRPGVSWRPGVSSARVRHTIGRIWQLRYLVQVQGGPRRPTPPLRWTRVGFLSLSSLSPDIHPHHRLAADFLSSSFALRCPASASVPPVERLPRLPGQLSVRREPCSFTQRHWATRGSPASSAQPVSTLLDLQTPRARISTTPSPQSP